MALKVDLSGVKSFLFEKGEKIALVGCLVGMGLLVGIGVLNGMGAKHVPGTNMTYPEYLTKLARELRTKQDGGETVEIKQDTNKHGPDWDRMVSTFNPSRYFEMQDRVATKRLNPRAVGILADEKNFQMDYIRGVYLAYDIQPQFKSATVVKDPKAAPVQPKNPFGFFQRQPKPAPNQPGQGLAPVITVQPKRMVVVNAVFPLEQQLEEFRKSFRLMTQAELFQTKDLPRFLGINVMKAEIIPGQPPVWTPLLRHNYQQDRLEVDPNLMATLREAIFDDTQVFVSAVQGLTMPLPKIGSLPIGVTYPEVRLPTILQTLDQAGVPGGMPGVGMPGGGFPGGGMKMPMGMDRMAGAGGKVGVDVEFESKKWDFLAPELKSKFYDEFYALDPAGIHPDPNEANPQANQPGAVPVAPIGRAGMPGAVINPFKAASPFSATQFWTRYPTPPIPPHLAALMNAANPAIQNQPAFNPNVPGAPTMKPYDALVRFVDVDVKPGRSYKYSIQVRIANPNFGRKNDVAYAALAMVKELPPAPFVETPTITIPEEYFLYAIDQKPDNPKIIHGSDDKDAKPDQVAIQIHRWVDRTVDPATNTDYVIGDWAIAERLLVRRGEILGRTTAVEIPVWDKKRATYDLGLAMVGASVEQQPKKGGFQLPPKNLGRPQPNKKVAGGAELGAVGIPVDFAATTPPAVLADFDGGKQTFQAPGTSIVRDESASNLLILNHDGKLIVRNTRIDSTDSNPEYRVRQRRIEEWKAKVQPFRSQMPDPNNNPNNPMNENPNPFLRN